MNSFIGSPTRAIAPRLPCSIPHCKICDSHLQHRGDIKINMPTPKPSLWERWMAMSVDNDRLPHLSHVATPEQIR